MNIEEQLSNSFLRQLKSVAELNDFIGQIQKRGIEQLLEGELDAHLGYEKNQVSDIDNNRNGHTTKKIKTSLGEQEIKVPRDRNSTFNPMIVPKRANMIEGIENVIVSLYAKGMSNGDIEEQIREIYNFDISTTSISRITDRITIDIQAWQNRPLEPVYIVAWMDGISFKVRENSKVINKTIYIAVGLKKDGLKEVLGLWLGKNESASFWMTVLTDMKARGVEDIFITATDNLKGFTDAVKSVFKQSITQICIVHQIRNSMKYVVWKDRKEVANDMKKIYDAPNMDAAKASLDDFSKKWRSKYPYAIKSWEYNWENLTAFLDFPVEIRKIIYTTNLIENLNGKIRKYTKNKLSFPTDEAVIKSAFLAIREATRKWNRPIKNWGLIYNQINNIFAERLENR
jgi:putative transposase